MHLGYWGTRVSRELEYEGIPVLRPSYYLGSPVPAFLRFLCSPHSLIVIRNNAEIHADIILELCTSYNLYRLYDLLRRVLSRWSCDT